MQRTPLRYDHHALQEKLGMIIHMLPLRGCYKQIVLQATTYIPIDNMFTRRKKNVQKISIANLG